MKLSREYPKVLQYPRWIKHKGMLKTKSLLSYCLVSGYMHYLGRPRRRDLLPQKEQLRKIALAQQKRERKALKKNKEI